MTEKRTMDEGTPEKLDLRSLDVSEERRRELLRLLPDNYTESLQTYLEYTGQVDSERRKFGTNTDSRPASARTGCSRRPATSPMPWRRRLDLLLGTQDWYDEFYSVEATKTLFGGEEARVVKASTATIGKYFLQRLQSVFAGVAPEAAVLRNSRNVPLYLLCFAVGNTRGTDIALRIANHLLKEMR